MSYYDQEGRLILNGKPFIKKEHRVWDDKTQSIIKSPRFEIEQDASAQINDKQLVVTNTVVSVESSVESSIDTTNDKNINEVVSISLSKHDIALLLGDLVGLQEKFFYFIVTCCNLGKKLQTTRLKYRDMAEVIQCSHNVIQNIAFKVVHKGLVQRLNNKTSKSGFVQFSLSNDVKEVGNYFMMRKKASDSDFKQFLAKVKTSQKAKNKYL